jgi:hypothetical protein
MSLQAFYSTTTANGCCKIKRETGHDGTVHINGVESDGKLDNNQERPAFIHGQMQDAMHIILRFAETSRREGESYLQKM